MRRSSTAEEQLPGIAFSCAFAFDLCSGDPIGAALRWKIVIHVLVVRNSQKLDRAILIHGANGSTGWPGHRNDINLVVEGPP